MRGVDVGLMITLAGLLFGAGVAWQKAEARADRLQEQVNTLKHLWVSEFPTYTAAISWKE